jgi:hypothetical protein
MNSKVKFFNLNDSDMLGLGSVVSRRHKYVRRKQITRVSIHVIRPFSIKHTFDNQGGVTEGCMSKMEPAITEV